MPTVNLGKVGMSLKGVFDENTQYEKLDVVYYDDSTYCAKANTRGNLPTDETYWQLIVAPNPLATWKPNTKEDEGYVQKGEGNEDSLWATDSDGNPAWVKKEDVATKVEKNSKTADGIVPKGNMHLSQVWATNNTGVPAWRDYINPKPVNIIETAGWEEDKKTGSGYVLEIAKFRYLPDSATQAKNFQGIWFSFYSGGGNYEAIKTNIYISMNDYSPQAFQWSNRKGGGASAYTDTNVWYLIYKNYNYYIGVLYRGDSDIYISNFSYTSNIVDFEWLGSPGHGAKYINLNAISNDTSYEFYHYAVWTATQTYLIDPVSPSENGIVPAPNGAKNRIFSTSPISNSPAWREPSDLNLLTSDEIKQEISTAIASADFSSFEIVEAQPTPETAVENKFYLVKNEETNHYDIYAKIGEKVEWIDDTTVDLSNYTTLTDEQYNALIQLLGE